MIICVDIDDTLLYSTLQPDGSYIVHGKNEKLIEKLNVMFTRGDTIYIYTARHWLLYSLTKRQLDEAGIKFTSLLMGKLVADVYIDDRGMRPDEFLG